jgi:hypothetical protein
MAKKTADGVVLNYFPAARGIRTDRYTMEIDINRDRSLKSISIFDDLKDPYQMDNIYGQDPHLLEGLCRILSEKLKESNDIWFREGILEKIEKENHIKQ